MWHSHCWKIEKKCRLRKHFKHDYLLKDRPYTILKVTHWTTYDHHMTVTLHKQNVKSRAKAVRIAAVSSPASETSASESRSATTYGEILPSKSTLGSASYGASNDRPWQHRISQTEHWLERRRQRHKMHGAMKRVKENTESIEDKAGQTWKGRLSRWLTIASWRPSARIRHRGLVSFVTRWETSPFL